MSNVSSQNEPRMSQILPTVKCSDCGRQVELRKLAIHLCSSVPPVPSFPNPRGVPAANPPPVDNRDYQPKAPPVDRYAPKNNYEGYGSYDTRPTADRKPEAYLAPDRSRPHDVQSAPRSPRKPAANDYYYGPESNAKISPREREDQRDYYNGGIRKNSTSPSPAHRQAPTYDPEPTRSPNNYGAPYQQKKSEDPYAKKDDSSYAAHGWFDDEDYEDIYNPTSDSGGALDSLVNDLMSKMTTEEKKPVLKAGPPNTPLPLSNSCSACGKGISRNEQIVNMESRCYHRKCFHCALCAVEFSDRQTYFEHEGKLFCERDYRVVKKRVYCSGCDKPLTAHQESMKALGKQYHVGHLQCHHCRQPLNPKTIGLVEHQGRVFCREDFKHLFLPKCRSCGLPVEKEAVSALDGKLQGKWHRNCFGCQTCHNAFPDNTFYVYDGAPYCKRHYHRLNNSLCRSCDEPIEGPCVQTIEGWRYHPVCLSCSVCRVPITDVYYIHENRTYCETHMLHLQRSRNVRAERRQTMFKNL